MIFSKAVIKLPAVLNSCLPGLLIRVPIFIRYLEVGVLCSCITVVIILYDRLAVKMNDSFFLILYVTYFGNQVAHRANLETWSPALSQSSNAPSLMQTSGASVERV